MQYSCSIIINLQRIVNGGNRTAETYHSEQDITVLSENFAKYICELLPLHTDLNDWSLQRIDYNIDVRISPEAVAQYIILLQRGDKDKSWKPKRLTGRSRARGNTKTKAMHPQGSVLYENTQYSVNIYDKQLERVKRQTQRGVTDTAELEACEGVLRIEIQAKANKLKNIKNKFYQSLSGKPLSCFARYEIATDIIMPSLCKIVGTADYWSYKAAANLIDESTASTVTKQEMKNFLYLTNRCRSVWKAKEKYNGVVKLETVLFNLQKLNINPVTIPKAFQKDTMENIFNIAAVTLAEENTHKNGENCIICNSPA